MKNDPYGLGERAETFLSLRAEIVKQRKKAKVDADFRYLEGRGDGRREGQSTHRQELRKWLVNVLLEKSETLNTDTVAEQAGVLERFIMEEK